MEKRISAADANREFSQLLKGARAGKSYLVTAHGKPVAKVVPADETGHGAKAARESLLARLRSQRANRIGRWTRDELYDRQVNLLASAAAGPQAGQGAEDVRGLPCGDARPVTEASGWAARR